MSQTWIHIGVRRLPRMAHEFTYQTFDDLREVSHDAFSDIVDGMIPEDERVIACYKTGKGGAVFTEKRVLAVDTKGLTGRKKIVTAVPYDKVSAYATESGSLPSFEGTLTLWNRGLGTIAFVFEEKTDIRPVLKAIAESS